MRIKPIIYGLCASLFFVSCAKETIDEQYVKLEQVTCSFYSTGNQPLEIKVKANPSVWEVESNAAWLEVGKSDDGGTLTLTVADNDSENERTTEVTVTAGEAMQTVKVYQLGFNGSMNRYRILPTHVMGSAISPSGQYVGGFEFSALDDDTAVYHPIIIDISTGTEYRCGEIPQSLAELYQTMVMTDDGLLFIYDSLSGTQIIFDRDGNYNLLETPGYVGVQVQATSTGGSKWVGFGFRSSENNPDELYHPLIWIDGQVHELKYPDENFRGEAFTNGIMARGISADGSVIYGTTWDNFDYGMVYWTDINEKARYVGEDVHEIFPVTMILPNGTPYDTHIANGMICYAELLKISPSGKWIAGAYRIETLTEDKSDIASTQYAAFYNTETEKTTIIEDYGESTGMYVTDDGIAFIGSGTLAISSGFAYDLNTKTGLGSITEWVFNNYGIHIPSGIINFINADGDVIFGTYPDYSAQGTTYLSFYIAPPLTE